MSATYTSYIMLAVHCKERKITKEVTRYDKITGTPSQIQEEQTERVFEDDTVFDFPDELHDSYFGDFCGEEGQLGFVDNWFGEVIAEVSGGESMALTAVMMNIEKISQVRARINEATGRDAAVFALINHVS